MSLLARSNDLLPIPTQDSVLVPLAELGQVANAGHLTTTLDVDGAARYEALVLQHFDEYYPSLSLMLAAQALNLKPEDIEVRLGEGVALGGLTIATTPELLMYNHFYSDVGGQPSSYACKPLPTGCNSATSDCTCFPPNTPCVQQCKIILGGGLGGFELDCPGG